MPFPRENHPTQLTAKALSSAFHCAAFLAWWLFIFNQSQSKPAAPRPLGQGARCEAAGILKG